MTLFAGSLNLSEMKNKIDANHHRHQNSVTRIVRDICETPKMAALGKLPKISTRMAGNMRQYSNGKATAGIDFPLVAPQPRETIGLRASVPRKN
jgi:hypothetical protein